MKTRKKEFRTFKVLSAKEAFENLVERKGDPGIEKRLALWARWDSIMGSPVIDLGFPLETKGTTIIMGAENNMAMQELSMLAPTILHRVNSFLGENNAYTKIVFTQTERPNQQERQQHIQTTMARQTAMPPPPHNFGHKLDQFSDDSIVSRCYRAIHAAYFSQDS